MALFNYATKEITLKLVYYGPGLSGKTTNLQYLHETFEPDKRGKLLSLSTESDRTLFFDFLPVDLGKIRDFTIRFQLYTVPGQVRYNATRKVVLKGADAVVFVADSQRDMKEQNIESFDNMMDNLRANNINPDEIPIFLQYNKRDLKNIFSVDELNMDLNPNGRYPVSEACAIDGTGVEDTYKKVIRLLLQNVSKKHNIRISPPAETEEAPSPVQEAAEETAPAAAVFAEAGSMDEETAEAYEVEPVEEAFEEEVPVLEPETAPAYTAEADVTAPEEGIDIGFSVDVPEEGEISAEPAAEPAAEYDVEPFDEENAAIDVGLGDEEEAPAAIDEESLGLSGSEAATDIPAADYGREQDVPPSDSVVTETEEYSFETAVTEEETGMAAGYPPPDTEDVFQARAGAGLPAAEAPAFPEHRLDELIGIMNEVRSASESMASSLGKMHQELVNSLLTLNNNISYLHKTMRDALNEQKTTNALLQQITAGSEKPKEKKRWI